MYFLAANIKDIPLWAAVVVLLIFAILLTIALVTGREVSIWQIKVGAKQAATDHTDESPAKTKQDPDKPIVGIDQFLNEVISNEQIRIQALNLIHELKKLQTERNELFQQAISVDFSEFLAEVKNWTRSCVKLQGIENDNFLIKIYKTARESVFSTCIMDYFEAWKSDFGEKLLEAHKNNGACDTTRVFIFHDKSDMTDDVMDFIRNSDPLMFAQCW
jgi:hypothetical protein